MLSMRNGNDYFNYPSLSLVVSHRVKSANLDLGLMFVVVLSCLNRKREQDSETVRKLNCTLLLEWQTNDDN